MFNVEDILIEKIDKYVYGIAIKDLKAKNKDSYDCTWCNSCCTGDCVNGCYSSCQGEGEHYY